MFLITNISVGPFPTKEDLKSYGTSLSLALLMRFFIVEPRFIPRLDI